MTDLDDRVSQMLHDRASAVTIDDRLADITADRAFRTSNSPQGGRRWAAVRVAAVAAGVIALIAGIALTTRGGAEPAAPGAATSPAATTIAAEIDGPVVFQPGPDDGTVIREQHRYDGPFGAFGAVLAADGTVFGLTLTPTSDDPFADPGFEHRTIAGHRVAGLIDASAAAEIYYLAEFGCATLSITTAGEPMWSPDTEALIAAVTVDGDTMTITVPDGWTSLGAADPDRLYVTSWAVDVGGTSHEITMLQAPGAPVGYYLTATETTPVDLAGDHLRAGTFALATSPGNQIVGVRDGTAYLVASDLAVDQLTTLIDELVPVAADGWADTAQDDDNATMATVEPNDGTCDIHILSGLD